MNDGHAEEGRPPPSMNQWPPKNNQQQEPRIDADVSAAIINGRDNNLDSNAADAASNNYHEAAAAMGGTTATSPSSPGSTQRQSVLNISSTQQGASHSPSGSQLISGAGGGGQSVIEYFAANTTANGHHHQGGGGQATQVKKNDTTTGTTDFVRSNPDVAAALNDAAVASIAVVANSSNTAAALKVEATVTTPPNAVTSNCNNTTNINNDNQTEEEQKKKGKKERFPFFSSSKLSKKKKKSSPYSNSSSQKPTPHPPPKTITIPHTIQPKHTYRAMSIYSLLRTLSTEIRLSPFPPQSFLRALLLPMPSKLLGEIHVRILRLLYANNGMGCYSKLGDGSRIIRSSVEDGALDLTSSLIHRRVRVKKMKKSGGDKDGGGDEDQIVEYEDVWTPKKGYDNLFFLDYTTWPLYFRDYALKTEDKFVFDNHRDYDDDGDDSNKNLNQDARLEEDNYINFRSVAMAPMESINMNPLGPPRFSSSSQSIDEDVDGNGKAGGGGWISRCPVGPLGKRNSAGRFVCCPFHVAAARKLCDAMPPPGATPQLFGNSNLREAKAMSSLSQTTMARGATNEMERPSISRTGGRRKAKSRKDHSDSSSLGSDSDYEDLSTPPDQKKARFHRATAAKHLSAPLSLASPMMKSVVPNPLGVATVPNFRLKQVIVPPIALLPADENSLLVPKDVEDTLTRYFKDGDLFFAPTEKEEKVNGVEDENLSGDDEYDNYASPFQITKFPPNEHLLTHMAPIELMEKGMPYHHLSVDSKLSILEFLLDELLLTDSISHEMARRHVVTENFSFPYGRPPLPLEYDGISNKDNCTICQLGGDLLCCDFCPGSYHAQCIGIEPNQQPPEGRWLCPECLIVDPAKMAPLSLPERRPLLGWFTLEELDYKETLVLQPVPLPSGWEEMIDPTSGMTFYIDHIRQTTTWERPGGGELVLSFVPNSLDNPIHHPMMINATNVMNAANRIVTLPVKADKQIPNDVEFLVASGKVFARYRSSKLPFDPLKPLESESSSDHVSTIVVPPPPALADAQVMELVKLLGPGLCFNFPWRQIQFTPERIFGKQEDEVDPSMKLVAQYQSQAKENRVTKAELYNPMTYTNRYRRAPHPPSMNALPGAANVFLLVPSVNYFPISTPLSVSMADPTMEQFRPIEVPYRDHMQSIRDKLISIERSLYDACLLDEKWGLNEDEIDLPFWRRKVEKAKSVKRLSSLLVELIDACSVRAFHSEWYDKQAVHPDGKPINIGKLADFNASHEIEIRRWERLTSADIFRFDNSRLKKIFDTVEPRGKRKKRKLKNDQNVASSLNTEELPAISAGSANEAYAECDTVESKSNVQLCHEKSPDVTAANVFSEELTTENDDIKSAEEIDATEDLLFEGNEMENKIDTSGPFPPTMAADLTGVVEKKASKYCIFEGCMKYKQAGTFGYCLTHKSHADPAKVAAAKAKLSNPVVKGKRSRKSVEPLAVAADLDSRRRSDRLQAMRRELETLLDQVETEAVDSRIAELRLDKLEKVLLDDDFKAEYFAIAGRKLFEPAGSISQSDTKRLGRNAGSIRVQTLRYDSAYEVAETSHCHHWRKKTLECNTYEELIHSLRFLDAHLDNSTLTKCCNIAKKKAAQPLKTTEIRCRYIDPSNGYTEYFVVPVNRIRGLWYSETNIDESNLILYRFDKRRQAQQNKRPPKPSAPVISKPAPTPPKATAAPDLNSMLPSQKMGKSYEAMFNEALNKHKIDTFELLKQSAAKGEKSVSVAAIGEARKANATVMRHANSMILKQGGKHRTDQEMKEELSSAENKAVQMYIANARKKKS